MKTTENIRTNSAVKQQCDLRHNLMIRASVHQNEIINRVEKLFRSKIKSHKLYPIILRFKIDVYNQKAAVF